MTLTYSTELVGLSVLVAILAAYTALDLTTRVASSTGLRILLWLMGGAVAMGVGIWGMHFVGMLATEMPMPAEYEVRGVGLSLLAAIATSAIALWGASRAQTTGGRTAAGFVMGLGIATMHYSGMAAMHLVGGTVEYRWGMVAVSIAYAIAGSVVALWIFSRLGRGKVAAFPQRATASIVLGLAIVGMHYTGMAAVRVHSASEHVAVRGISSTGLAPIVAVATISILVIALFASYMQRMVVQFTGGAAVRATTVRDALNGMAKAVAVIGILVVGVMAYSAIIRARDHNHHRPYLAGLTAQREQLLMVHLFLEEALAGDAAVDAEQVIFQPLATAVNRCTSPAAREDSHVESESQELTLMLAAYCSSVQQLSEATSGRWALRGNLVESVQADISYDSVFTAAVAHSTAISDHYLAMIERENRMNTWMSLGLMVLVIASGMGVLAMVRSTGRFILRNTREVSRLASIVENSVDAIYSLTLDGTVLSWNRGAEQLFGYSASEMVGTSIFRLLTPEGSISLADVLERLSQGALSYEATRMRKDRTEVEVSVSASPIKREDGELIGMSVIARDITDRNAAEHARIEAESERRGREASDAANRAKSDFLANMSHEIRTPMNGVIGMLDLAMDTDLDAEQVEYVSIAHSSAESLLSVINDILDFSKVEAGKLELDNTNFQITESISNVVSTLALRAHKKGLELAFEIAPNVPDAVNGDIGRVRQILFNLIGNAIKFTHAGEVVLRVTRALDDDQMLHFSVEDTGIGIPADKLDLVFDAFSQADTSTTRLYGGTGLGLAISSRLVDLMGGKIWVESVAGSGSTFHFTARLPEAEAAARVTREVDRSELQGLDVLIVDDNYTNRLILGQLVTRMGMCATVVESAAAAQHELHAAAAANRKFAFILVDAMMPDMDGFALIAEVKKNHEYACVPIMMLSSADKSSDAARCREIGVSQYLVKPVRRDQLERALLVARGDAGALPARPRPRQSISMRPLRILLAEDNAVNQKLAVAVLTKQGHTVVTVENGALAVERSAIDKFDVVLMDMQMPVMSGIEATREIRQRERSTGEYVPIVALTARVMQEDREKCTEAGMDGYVSKPLRREELFAVLNGLIPHEDEAAPQLEGSIWNEADLIDLVSGDEEMAASLAQLFIADSVRRSDALGAALATRDGQALQSAAHALYGATASLQAPAAARVARELELLEGDDLWAQRAALTAELKLEISSLNERLQSFVDSR